jgi:hypothetical protein
MCIKNNNNNIGESIMNENENYESEFQMIQRIKREYEEATPWRNFAIAVVLAGVFLLGIAVTALN